jgi:uncharacterized protein involved in exopolysaccharide biosynthesis
MPENRHSVFEPPDSFVLSAIRWNKLLILACALACAVIGIAYGLARTPVYTASASLQVGQVNPNSPGFLGYVQSASSLAAAFSRSIDAAPVLSAVEKQVGVSSREAVESLTSEPIPLSPVFRVIATSSDEGKATALANVASQAVIKYQSHTNSANPEAKSLLGEYRGGALAVQKAKDKVAQLESEGARAPQIAAAEAQTKSAQVRLKAVGNAYNTTIVSQAPRTGMVTILAGATSASSDRKSKVELFGFLGLLLGCALGCVLAVLRERRDIPRGAQSPLPEPGPAR